MRNRLCSKWARPSIACNPNTAASCKSSMVCGHTRDNSDDLILSFFALITIHFATPIHSPSCTHSSYQSIHHAYTHTHTIHPIGSNTHICTRGNAAYTCTHSSHIPTQTLKPSHTCTQPRTFVKCRPPSSAPRAPSPRRPLCSATSNPRALNCSRRMAPCA